MRLQICGFEQQVFFAAFEQRWSLAHGEGKRPRAWPFHELVQLFDLDRVHKGGAKFDPEKTKWFNQQYLRARPDAELGAQLQAKLKEQGTAITLERATAP